MYTNTEHQITAEQYWSTGLPKQWSVLCFCLQTYSLFLPLTHSHIFLPHVAVSNGLESRWKAAGNHWSRSCDQNLRSTKLYLPDLRRGRAWGQPGCPCYVAEWHSLDGIRVQQVSISSMRYHEKGNCSAMYNYVYRVLVHLLIRLTCSCIALPL